MTESKSTTPEWALPMYNHESGLLTDEQWRFFVRTTWPRLKPTLNKAMYEQLCRVLGDKDAKASEAKEPKLVQALRETQVEMPTKYNRATRVGFFRAGVMDLPYTKVELAQPSSIKTSEHQFIDDHYERLAQFKDLSNAAVDMCKTVVVAEQHWMANQLRPILGFCRSINYVREQLDATGPTAATDAAMRPLEDRALSDIERLLAEAEAKDRQAAYVRRWLAYYMVGCALRAAPCPTVTDKRPADTPTFAAVRQVEHYMETKHKSMSCGATTYGHNTVNMTWSAPTSIADGNTCDVTIEYDSNHAWTLHIELGDIQMGVTGSGIEKLLEELDETLFFMRNKALELSHSEMHQHKRWEYVGVDVKDVGKLYSFAWRPLENESESLRIEIARPSGKVAPYHCTRDGESKLLDDRVPINEAMRQVVEHRPAVVEVKAAATVQTALDKWDLPIREHVSSKHPEWKYQCAKGQGPGMTQFIWASADNKSRLVVELYKSSQWRVHTSPKLSPVQFKGATPMETVDLVLADVKSESATVEAVDFDLPILELCGMVGRAGLDWACPSKRLVQKSDVVVLAQITFTDSKGAKYIIEGLPGDGWDGWTLEHPGGYKEAGTWPIWLEGALQRCKTGV